MQRWLQSVLRPAACTGKTVWVHGVIGGGLGQGVCPGQDMQVDAGLATMNVLLDLYGQCEHADWLGNICVNASRIDILHAKQRGYRRCPEFPGASRCRWPRKPPGMLRHREQENRMSAAAPGR